MACLDVRLPQRASQQAAAKLQEITTAECPCGNENEIARRDAGNSWSGGMTEEEIAAAIWVKPRYKAEVTFLEWTKGGNLRHAQIKQLFA